MDKRILGVVIVVALAVGAYFAFKPADMATETAAATDAAATDTAAAATKAAEEAAAAATKAAEEAAAATAKAAEDAAAAATKAAADAAAAVTKAATDTAAAATTAATDTAAAATKAATEAAAAATNVDPTYVAELDPANFNADKVITLIQNSPLDDASKTTLVAGVTAAAGNPALVDGALAAVKSALGMN